VEGGQRGRAGDGCGGSIGGGGEREAQCAMVVARVARTRGGKEWRREAIETGARAH